MSDLNYITKILELKDNNIKFYEILRKIGIIKRKLREYIIKFSKMF